MGSKSIMGEKKKEGCGFCIIVHDAKGIWGFNELLDINISFFFSQMWSRVLWSLICSSLASLLTCFSRGFSRNGMAS